MNAINLNLRSASFGMLFSPAETSDPDFEKGNKFYLEQLSKYEREQKTKNSIPEQKVMLDDRDYLPDFSSEEFARYVEKCRREREQKNKKLDLNA